MPCITPRLMACTCLCHLSATYHKPPLVTSHATTTMARCWETPNIAQPSPPIMEALVDTTTGHSWYSQYFYSSSYLSGDINWKSQHWIINYKLNCSKTKCHLNISIFCLPNPWKHMWCIEEECVLFTVHTSTSHYPSRCHTNMQIITKDWISCRC